MIENIDGVFQVEIDDVLRDVKCNFGVVERLERNIFKRPIVSVLNEALNENIYFSEVVDTLSLALKANGDTRLSRDELGESVRKRGLIHYYAWYISFLTYAITGGQELETEEVEDSKKKLS